MGQKFRTLTMLTLLLTATSIPTLAEAPLAAQQQPEERKQQQADTSISTSSQAVDITALLHRISAISTYTEWQGAAAQLVRSLHNPEGRQQALLWSVQANGQPAGYLVTSPDGQHVYEFSRGAVPTLPEHLQGKELTEGYIYAGPMLHLVYYHTDGDTLDLYNLQTGETLPWGELKNKVPASGATVAARQSTVEHEVEVSNSPDSDALYATGRFGQLKLEPDDNEKGVRQLRSYAAGDTFTEPSYIVYDAVPDKLTIALQVTKVVSQGEAAYLQVRNPFTPETESVYIDSRFPVSVFLSASSAT
ncbi:hypothetical protein CBW65_21395 [Tumebacillus avium]|uniref:Uncharacterized protein n=1 Tax=Tumebacillus avium TaxID=1903704 RepID=A0A1Y0IS24_9BACL|nr:hypothetical protein [Tumebacillus avium]ARU63247.1 hypothetical protein CBW65_21395 [Tumebacillus avium]